MRDLTGLYRALCTRASLSGFRVQGGLDLITDLGMLLGV